MFGQAFDAAGFGFSQVLAFEWVFGQIVQLGFAGAFCFVPGGEVGFVREDDFPIAIDEHDVWRLGGERADGEQQPGDQKKERTFHAVLIKGIS